MNGAALGRFYYKISQFHENQRLIAWLGAQRWVIWLNPERRKFILFVGAIVAGIVGTFSRKAAWRDYRLLDPWLVHGAAFLMLLGIVYGLYLAAAHFKRLPALMRGWPQLCFHLFFWLLLVTLWCAPEPAGWWSATLTVVALSFPYLIWRAGYMLLSGQRGKVLATRLRDHLFYIWPVWDGTNTPPGKGPDHLSRAVASTPDGYARVFLGGIKLLLLVALWKIVMQLMGALIYGDPKIGLTSFFQGNSLGLPRLRQIVANPAAVPLPLAWLCLYLELIWETLFLAAKGHVWVGVLRLFGFNVFRNTYKPLLAETLVDFWNRYYYYFKELMMEFFFLPTYARYFRQRATLRILAAVFAAAFLGNLYYHLLQAKEPLVSGDGEKLWALLGSRVVYCFLLASGIAISMLRQQRQRSKAVAGAAMSGGALQRLRRIAAVWTFFAVINFWNVIADLTLLERARRLLSLFGL